MGKELLPLFKLPGDGFFRFAVFGIECLVITICTAPQPLRSIAVGTCKTRIERYLLYLVRKIFFRKKVNSLYKGIGADSVIEYYAFVNSTNIRKKL